MQLLRAMFKKGEKVAVRTYHARRLSDGQVQILAADTFNGGHPSWHDLGVYDPDTAGIFARLCHVALNAHAANISRSGWHRIG